MRDLLRIRARRQLFSVVEEGDGQVIAVDFDLGLEALVQPPIEHVLDVDEVLES